MDRDGTVRTLATVCPEGFFNLKPQKSEALSVKKNEVLNDQNIKKPSLVIVGAGKVGSALSILLHKKGYPVAGVASKSISSARRVADEVGCLATDKPEEVTLLGEIVFITTPDREIARVAENIASRKGFYPGQIVAHASGAHTASELRGVPETGSRIVSIHPLQSFADLRGAIENLPGSYFALEGDESAMIVARQIVDDLDGKCFTIRAEDKPLYHAAACIASNYLVSLMYYATGLYRNFGLSREEAFEALLPLVQGTINNVRRIGPVQALTGPIARGDGTTILDHIPVLKQFGKEESDLYNALGLYTVSIALEKGSINRDQAVQLNKIFS
ncbi:MAG: hypothetical protein XE00_0106 [Desulfofundulus kuznetsovii]|nr:MAG: hypothetical protein XD84_1022 [Desulfotomaculum sp. 46_80]KUK85394.1 MAG: hypothetical protein XE00_0106 [Desulfofundulus kuznetsovii]